MLRSQVIGGQGLRSRLTAVSGRAKDLRPFWGIFGARYFSLIQDVFSLEGQRRNDLGRFSQGGTWERLSPPYAKWKARHYPGKRILEREGDLRDSLRWTGNGLGPGGVWLSTAQSLTYGTSIPYARYHQKGIPGRLPARPFLYPVNKSVLAPVLKQWIAKGDDA